jgi:precorrin-3B methylase
LPPSLQLITRLARTKTPAESNAVLEAQRALLDDAFLQQFDAYLDSVKEHLAGEELARLQQIREQAQAKMAIQRG